MKKLLSVFLICFAAVPAFCQSESKYQVATIMAVNVHEAGERVGASDAISYDVSVKVGDTIYVVLYTPPLREITVKYAAGRSALVLVGKDTIRYNDLLGRSFDLPIESQRPAATPNHSGGVSRAGQ
jgi:predicted S18 family serine protease